MTIETRLQRLEARRRSSPTHEEWVDYMAALERRDHGRHTDDDRAMIAAFTDRLSATSPERAAAYLTLE
jgi:hypothetical protein